MNSKGKFYKDNNQPLPPILGLREKAKELCKLSQEKHVIRMVLARSKVVKERRLPSCTKKTFPAKSCNESIEVKHKEIQNCPTKDKVNVKTVQQNIKSAPREKSTKKPSPQSPFIAPKCKSQGFRLKKGSPEFISSQQTNHSSKKATVFSNSTPKKGLKSKQDWQAFSAIKKNAANTISPNSSVGSKKSGDTKVAIKKTPDPPPKINLKDKPSKCRTVASFKEPKKEEISVLKKINVPDKLKKIGKTVSESCKNISAIKDLKKEKLPVAKTIKRFQSIPDQPATSCVLKKPEKTPFNPSLLTSYEINLEKNNFKEENLCIKDVLNNLNEPIENNSQNVIEENLITNESKNCVHDKISEESETSLSAEVQNKTQLRRSKEDLAVNENKDIISNKISEDIENETLLLGEILKKTPSRKLRENRKFTTPNLTTPEMKNKVLKYSEWRKNCNISPVSENPKLSGTVIRQEQQDRKPSQTCYWTPDSRSSKYFTPPTFLSNSDLEESNLVPHDMSIDQINSFKVNPESNDNFDSNISLVENSVSSLMESSINLEKNNGIICEDSSENEKNNYKSDPEPPKSPGKFTDAIWINFAKAFAENTKKSKYQKKLRSMGFSKPILNLTGDTSFSAEDIM